MTDEQQPYVHQPPATKSFSIRDMKKWLFLGFLILVLSLELQVTLPKPIAFGDEGFHVTTARYIGENVEYPLTTALYGSELQPERYNRLPLWNLVEGSFYMFFGFNDIIVKILQPLISILTGLVVYIFVKKLYNQDMAIIAGIISVAIPSFVTYAVAFYTVIPYVFFLSIALFSFLTAMKTNERKYWILASVFSGLAILTNVAGIFMLILIATMGIVKIIRNLNLHNVVDTIKRYGFVILIAVLILMPWVGRNLNYFYVEGCTNAQAMLFGNCPQPNQYQSSFEFEGRTVEVGTETGVLSLGITNYLQFAYGFGNANPFLNLIGISFIPFVFIAGLFVLMRKREIHDIGLVVSTALLIILFFQFGGAFSGRAEDTARYFLTAVPIIGAVSASYINRLIQAANKYREVIMVLAVVIVVILSMMSITQKLQIMGQVKTFLPSFFQTCDWVKQNTPEDANLLSFHTYPTRYNCERGAVWEIPDKGDIILSNNLTLVTERLKANGIDYIFVQKFSLSRDALGQSYPISFVTFLEQNNQTFQKVFENGLEMNQCLAQGICDGNAIYKVL